ncbi:hypothetical protein LRS06_21765 [Hymenobacter sp. J193]|uniref:hypothetical protein n=1 Tax=Hymenobacter sp. J193 TaxID=2898429 RepID=UPI0021508DBB|nr:hypothetical protein [Hymenobacter sp. J193]MCR5890358.1 hypothetical protein [Hymenobacter sp. J193]
MNVPALSQPATLISETSQPESPVACRIREIRQSALAMLSHALRSPLISDSQRAVATAKAAGCHDIWQLIKWHTAVIKYVAEVKAGVRLSHPEPEQAQEPEPARIEPQVPEVTAAGTAQKQAVLRGDGGGQGGRTRQYRPARRMSAEKLVRLRAANQARRDAVEQRRVPMPMWAETPRLTALPGGLCWSGQGEVPEVGKALMVSRNGGLSGKATVRGYFHAEGFLGLVADFENIPAKYQQAPRSLFVFGRDVQPIAA